MRHRASALAILLSAGAAILASGQSSGRLHVVQSLSGSRGTPQGERFVMEDPRTVFHAGKDRQVLVFFEWQGPSGRHHCEGNWKDPSGRVVFTSAADVDARGPRFGVYWGLSLPDTVTTGNWVLEATVDGEPAGVHAFQILAAPAGTSAPPVRRPLAVADLYQKGLMATLAVEAVDASGSRLDQASGLFVSPDLVLTTFGVLNEARKVRVLAGDGRRFETADVVSWNRRANWAFLRVAGAKGQPIARAPARPEVGDRCYFLETQSDGSRAIVEVSVVGRSGTGDLVISEASMGATVGAPVLNEYGEFVGTTISRLSLPGVSALDIALLGTETGDYARGEPVRGFPSLRVRGFPPLPAEGSVSRTLEDLERAGEFVRALARTPHSVNGILGTGVERQGQARIPVATDQRFRFSRAEKSCVIFVTWIPGQKQDSTVAFELFDEDNRHLGGTKPAKAKLRPGESFVQYWTIPLSTLAPGIYRVDVMLGSDPVWRTLFRVTD
jgi:hypothetical protein